jgi:DNA-binding NarL/FixJ family response regulator
LRGLICDDHPLMRQALVVALRARWPGATLDEAGNFPTAWVLAGAQPDFCLVDLAMPGAEPEQGVAGLRARAPSAALLVITGLTDEALLHRIRSCGVTALLSKNSEPGMLVEAIGAAVPGLRGMEAVPLPPRQRQVLGLVSAGLTNKEIALRLGLSPATVKIHVARAINFLDAANRTDAVQRAQRAGLI